MKSPIHQRGTPFRNLDFSSMNWSNVLKVNTKEYGRVMATKVVALRLRLLCIKYGANPRCVEGDTVKILGDVRI